MTLPLWIIALLTIAETFLIVLVFLFFLRLRKSEDSLSKLQANQQFVLEKIYQNAALEQELVDTFTERQRQLLMLNKQLEDRAEVLRKLIDQAVNITRSPQFLREIILSGYNKGQNTQQISKSTGLTVDEVEIILAQAQNA